MRSAPAPLFALLAAALPARAGDAEVLAAWRALLDAPERAIAAHDLRWVSEPLPAREDPAAGSFLGSRVAPDFDALAYLGYLGAPENPAFASVHALPARWRRSFHVYRYGRHYLLSAGDGRRVQLSLYSVARALELLRRREPRLYEELFVGPRTAAEQLARLRARDGKKAVHFLNLTRGFAFVLDGGFPAIAQSEYLLGTRRPVAVEHGGERLADVGLFENLAVVTLNLDFLQGEGSRLLYGSDDLVENFLRYLRDGLVETLVHEALHCLLRRDKNVRALFWTVVESVRALGGEALGKPCEEALVANVSSRLFRGRPGLSPRVSAFYQQLFSGPHRARLGLLPGRETDAGVALRALLARHASDPDAPYERLFFFSVLPNR
ncbi:MAG: hypothetical protein D6731_20510 [Planctomycetota bacterium]|nr:MAG: hypothetical protein D6731_20510 [Planctomycetota bacterium]